MLLHPLSPEESGSFLSWGGGNSQRANIIQLEFKKRSFWEFSRRSLTWLVPLYFMAGTQSENEKEICCKTVGWSNKLLQKADWQCAVNTVPEPKINAKEAYFK